jgi:hypothetical protein
LEDAGVIRIKEKKDLTDKFTGWSDWNKLTQGGVGQELEILLTSRGKQLNLSSDTNYARIRPGSFEITEIKSNEQIEKNFDRYCLVTGLHRTAYLPEFKRVLSQLKKPVPGENRKFRTLFKFDKITDRWNVVAIDVADAGVEFESNNVQRALDDPSAVAPTAAAPIPNSATAKSEKPEVTTLDAVQLLKDCQKFTNEGGVQTTTFLEDIFDQKYLNQRVKYSGTVDKASAREQSIVFKSTGSYPNKARVEVLLSNVDAAVLSSLKSGSQVAIEGKITELRFPKGGLSVFGPGPSRTIQLVDAKLLSE